MGCPPGNADSARSTTERARQAPPAFESTTEHTETGHRIDSMRRLIVRGGLEWSRGALPSNIKRLGRSALPVGRVSYRGEVGARSFPTHQRAAAPFALLARSDRISIQARPSHPLMIRQPPCFTTHRITWAAADRRTRLGP